jgi:alkanesulfonate monooxygenase SsuD/methylene tetrahydromethanopterin reductase-like flavin-dependent oxidoreductase (luciferase family)
MSSVAFGIFDHQERREDTLGALYDGRLRLLKMADEAGFYCYHLAEHHATPLGMAPSPSLFLAAAIQHTKRIRLGPLVYLLPLYHPLRLIEEICMLDHMSNGRLEIGVGRGVSPFEQAYFGVPFLHSRAMFQEALEMVVAGLRQERLSYQGRHYECVDVPIELHPKQTPNPPFWYGVVNPNSLQFAAERGMHMASGGPNNGLKKLTAQYQDMWSQNRDNPLNLNPHIEAPKMGALRHIFVAETDQEAETIATPAYKKHYDNIEKLWLDFGVAHTLFTPDLDVARSRDVAIVGSPSRVQDAIASFFETSGCNYILGSFAWGGLTQTQSERSMELFATQVMPKFG